MHNFLHSFLDRFLLEKSKNIYKIPLNPETKIKNILYDWPSHEGPFKGAVDLAVELGSDVLAPLDGVVAEVVDRFDEYGVGEEYGHFLNYITISHENEEYSQLAHIAKGPLK